MKCKLTTKQYSIRTRCYGIPGGHHRRQYVGYRINVFKGICTWFVSPVDFFPMHSSLGNVLFYPRYPRIKNDIFFSFSA